MFRLAWIHLSFRGVRIWRRINNRHGEMITCKYYRTGRSIRESFDVREQCDLKNKKARMKVCNANRVQANEFVREHERTENCSSVACLPVTPQTTRAIATRDRLVKRWECRTKRSCTFKKKKKCSCLGTSDSAMIVIENSVFPLIFLIRLETVDWNRIKILELVIHTYTITPKIRTITSTYRKNLRSLGIIAYLVHALI